MHKLLDDELLKGRNILLTYLLHGAESFLRSQLVLQLIKKFPAFYGTRKFITVLTSASHLSLPWASLIQFIPPHPTSWRSILIYLPIYAWVFQVVAFLQVSPPKPCTRLSSHPYALHTPPILFFSILSSGQYWVRSTDHSAHCWVRHF